MYLYVTIPELKELTNLQNNVDDYRITNAMKFAQETKLDTILTKDLTAEIQSQIASSAVTTLNQTLIDSYLKSALAWWTIVEGYYDLHYSLTNKGVVTKNSDPQSATVTSSQLEGYRQYLKDRAEFYSEKLRTYLNDNKSSYPLYKTGCSNSASGNFGIYIPGDSDYDRRTDIRRFLD